MSNVKGEILPSLYTDILNLGTSDEPFYFTEKFIEEAKIYIVNYFNKDGVLVRKLALKEQDYEKVFCDQ